MHSRESSMQPPTALASRRDDSRASANAARAKRSHLDDDFSGLKHPTLRRVAAIVLTLLSAVLIYAVARSGWYTSGSDLGYNLGLVGALMMLALLGYPLRKRFRFLSFAGRINRWFSLHMVLGVAGPVLILLHCTLRWRSLNAAIAFWCMVIVASSGLLGRYLYRRLHQGLYGRQLNLVEVRTDTAVSMSKAKDALRFDGGTEALAIIESFAKRCATVEIHGWRRPLALVALGFHGYRARSRLVAEGQDPKMGQPFLSRQAIQASTDCIDAMQRSARFLPYERLFTLWHVLHVPLVILLVISTIAHVIAVHMY